MVAQTQLPTLLPPLLSGRFTRLQSVLPENERNIPTHRDAFKALFDVGPMALVDKIRPEGLWRSVDRDRLAEEVSRCIGLESLHANSRHAPDPFVGGRWMDRARQAWPPGVRLWFVSPNW